MVGYDCRCWREYFNLTRTDFVVKFVRGSGSGGQKRNKTSNAVELKFFHLKAEANEERSRELNWLRAERRLKLLIALDGTPSFARRKKWSAAEISLKKAECRLVPPSHADYALGAGHVLDLFLVGEGDWDKLALALNISQSALSKWFQAYPPFKKLLLSLRQDLI